MNDFAIKIKIRIYIPTAQNNGASKKWSIILKMVPVQRIHYLSWGHQSVHLLSTSSGFFRTISRTCRGHGDVRWIRGWMKSVWWAHCLLCSCAAAYNLLLFGFFLQLGMLKLKLNLPPQDLCVIQRLSCSHIIIQRYSMTYVSVFEHWWTALAGLRY